MKQKTLKIKVYPQIRVYPEELKVINKKAKEAGSQMEAVKLLVTCKCKVD